MGVGIIPFRVLSRTAINAQALRAFPFQKSLPYKKCPCWLDSQGEIYQISEAVSEYF